MSEYVIVRREPTQEMQLAGARSIIDGQDNRGASWAQEAAKCHAAMCAASPRPQSVLTPEDVWADDGVMGANAWCGLEMPDLWHMIQAAEAMVLRKLGGE